MLYIIVAHDTLEIKPSAIMTGGQPVNLVFQHCTSTFKQKTIPVNVSCVIYLSSTRRIKCRWDWSPSKIRCASKVSHGADKEGCQTSRFQTPIQTPTRETGRI